MGTGKPLLLVAVAAMTVGALAACSHAAAGGSGKHSGGATNQGTQQTQTKALPKVTPPANPPSIEPDFPVGTWKSKNATLVIGRNGIVTETIKGKTGRALYQDTGSREVRFGPDDARICDSDGTGDLPAV